MNIIIQYVKDHADELKAAAYHGDPAANAFIDAYRVYRANPNSTPDAAHLIEKYATYVASRKVQS